jgi:hypothetical protein
VAVGMTEDLNGRLKQAIEEAISAGCPAPRFASADRSRLAGRNPRPQVGARFPDRRTWTLDIALAGCNKAVFATRMPSPGARPYNSGAADWTATLIQRCNCKRTSILPTVEAIREDYAATLGRPVQDDRAHLR